MSLPVEASIEKIQGIEPVGVSGSVDRAASVAAEISDSGAEPRVAWRWPAGSLTG
jgi:hypothetical protein